VSPALAVEVEACLAIAKPVKGVGVGVLVGVQVDVLVGVLVGV